MKRLGHILLNLLVWSLLIAYLVVAGRHCTRQENEQLCRDIRVVVKDSIDHPFITAAMVEAWFDVEGINVRKKPLNELNTIEIQQFIERRGYVKSAKVYTTIEGLLNIEIVQRTPIVRINTTNGYDFYITDDDYILPAQRYAVVYVPIVTGVMPLSFPRGYVGPLKNNTIDNQKKATQSSEFLYKLINFVKFVVDDPFWSAQIVQIQVSGGEATEVQERAGGETPTGSSVNEPRLELVPRMGNQVILLGTLDDYPEKLEKLIAFYQKGLAYEGWERYSSINLQYKGQVVCR